MSTAAPPAVSLRTGLRPEERDAILRELSSQLDDDE